MADKWELERAAWSDRHHHIEVNVVEGELHVTCGDETLVAGPGETISVPAGAAARTPLPGSPG
jgi:ethanolamine utilization protein EutQ (cupin superfamily)